MSVPTLNSGSTGEPFIPEEFRVATLKRELTIEKRILAESLLGVSLT